MRVTGCAVMVAILVCWGCPGSGDPELPETVMVTRYLEQGLTGDTALHDMGPLLLPRFKSLDELKAIALIEYGEDLYGPDRAKGKRPLVRLTYRGKGGTVTSVLRSGVSQSDFAEARLGTFWERLVLGVRCPFAVIHRKDLMRIEHMARRRPLTFGRGDVAFYHLAETMVHHIVAEDRVRMSDEELSEKGYLNTFNHITAQAFMTSVFSEAQADFVADMHELYNLPDLATGHFTAEQLADLNEGPVDNYIDMINNEWGQEVGKTLQQSYSIDRHTVWTPAMLADYLNDIQRYLSWSFQIGFVPFTPEDKIVIHFAGKINYLVHAWG